MYYYIIDNRIVGYEALLSEEFYIHQQLTPEQSNLYEANPTASLNEVLNLPLMSAEA